MMALLPNLRRMRDITERLAWFEALERRFSRIARANILIAGATGVYLLFRLDTWGWFATVGFWWLDAMVFVWLLFAVCCSCSNRCFCIVASTVGLRHLPTRLSPRPFGFTGACSS